MTVLVWILICFLIGALVPIQAAINARLAATLSSMLLTGTISAGTACATLLILYFLTSGIEPKFSIIQETSWWMWLGGFIAPAYLLVIMGASSRLGSTAMIALLIAGQILSSLLVDVRGLLGATQRQLETRNLLGLILIFIGACLVVWRKT
jgi:transporter family-2 protein